MKKSSELNQLEDIEEAQDKTNVILVVNTIATVGSFIFAIVMSILLWNK